MPNDQLPPPFPSELLNAHNTLRLAYFDRYTMGHPLLDAAFEIIKPVIREHGESRLIFVVGPTGAGKTKLRLLVEKWIIEGLLAQLDSDPGRIPVASVEAVLHKSGLFNSKDHLKRSLYALNEPEELIKHKINYGIDGIYPNERGELTIRSRILETDLGWALEQALKYRRPQIFFIDEAHHMLAVASGRKLTDAPEAIKSLANRTEVLHGLIGTYELLALHDIGDQLSRRSVYIHLPRYNAELSADREIWSDIIWNFQIQIPTKECPDLESIWDYLYERSLGCVGILKNWLRNTLADALEEETDTISRKQLEKRALSVGQCRNILKKIKEGETRYADIEGDVVSLRQELGLGLEPTDQADTPTSSSVGGKSKGRLNVGRRKARRDPIGHQSNAAG